MVIESPTWTDLLAWAEALAAGPRRVLLGLCGAPGAGKSTLAEALVAALGPRVALVTMDGFHLDDAVLDALGRRDRKGAPDTFDVDGYLSLLTRLRHPEPGRCVYAPRFDRSLESSIGSAVPVPDSVALVLTEGNYLLLDQGPWAGVAGLLDEVWFLQPPEDVRLSRLVARHERYGHDPSEAQQRARGSDQVNAELVRAASGRAHRRFPTPPDVPWPRTV